jgi:hypothetical protein
VNPPFPATYPNGVSEPDGSTYRATALEAQSVWAQQRWRGPVNSQALDVEIFANDAKSAERWFVESKKVEALLRRCKKCRQSNCVKHS